MHRRKSVSAQRRLTCQHHPVYSETNNYYLKEDASVLYPIKIKHLDTISEQNCLGQVYLECIHCSIYLTYI